MLQRFKSFTRKHQLCNDRDTILLSVSGGIDSMVMAHLFQQAGIPVAMAHCNFKLRGDESDENECFIKKYAEQNQLRLWVKSFETRTYAAKQKISIQMAARELRIQWFENLLAEQGYSAYATAHHLDDQIETFFINLMRGTGIKGLQGILPKIGNLIHPMLFAYRHEIEEYAQNEGIDFSTDSSNLTRDYERNKIRHDLLPLLEKIKPGFRELMTGNIVNFRAASEIYKREIAHFKDKTIIRKENHLLIQLDKIEKALNPAVYLFEILRDYQFNFVQCQTIVNQIRGMSGKIFKSVSHQVVKDREYLILQPIVSEELSVINISKETRELQDPLQLEIRTVVLDDDYKIPTDPKMAALDADKLIFPLTLRKWETGDHFYPLGMNHSKRISDFFIDNKFSIPQKNNTWILESDGRIVWIVGHRIDNRFKITAHTQYIYEIRMKGPE